MKVSTERLDGSRVQMNVEIDPERVEQSLEKAYKRLATKANIPGFRKGKVPRAMLERYLGREAVLQEALDDLVAHAYDDAILQESVDAVARPEIEMLQLEPVIFKAIVPVRPEVELGDYRSIRMPLEVPEVKDEDVDTVLRQAQDQAATFEPVDREVAYGDVVSADITGSIDGNEFLNQKEASILVTEDTKSPVPGFHDALVGLKKDEEKDLEFSFPADHEEQNLAGHAYTFKVIVHEVREKRLPSLDDELARTLGDGLETLEQLKGKIRENLETRSKHEARAKLEEDVLAALSTSAKLEIPEALVDQEVESRIQRQTERLRDQKLSLERYLEIMRKSKEDLAADIRPAALEFLRREFILDRVANEENVQVTDEEIQARIEVAAISAGPQAAAVRNLFSSAEARVSLLHSLRTEKTVELLLDIATDGAISREKVELAEEEIPSSGSSENEASSGQADAAEITTGSAPD